MKITCRSLFFIILSVFKPFPSSEILPKVKFQRKQTKFSPNFIFTVAYVIIFAIVCGDLFLIPLYR